MGTILLWSLNLNVMCKSVSKWRPFPFNNYLSRLQTITVEGHVASIYNYVQI